MQQRTFRSIDETVEALRTQILPQLRKARLPNFAKYERLFVERDPQTGAIRSETAKLLRHMLALRMTDPETGQVTFHPGKAGFDAAGIDWPKSPNE